MATAGRDTEAAENIELALGTVLLNSDVPIPESMRDQSVEVSVVRVQHDVAGSFDSLLGRMGLDAFQEPCLNIVRAVALDGTSRETARLSGIDRKMMHMLCEAIGILTSTLREKTRKGKAPMVLARPVCWSFAKLSDEAESTLARAVRSLRATVVRNDRKRRREEILDHLYHHRGEGYDCVEDMVLAEPRLQAECKCSRGDVCSVCELDGKNGLIWWFGMRQLCDDCFSSWVPWKTEEYLRKASGARAVPWKNEEYLRKTLKMRRVTNQR